MAPWRSNLEHAAGFLFLSVTQKATRLSTTDSEALQAKVEMLLAGWLFQTSCKNEGNVVKLE